MARSGITRPAFPLIRGIKSILIKSVSLTAYASYYGNYCCYGTDYDEGTDSNIRGANVNIASPFTGAGGKAAHSVSSWTGYTGIGYYE